MNQQDRDAPRGERSHRLGAHPPTFERLNDHEGGEQRQRLGEGATPCAGAAGARRRCCIEPHDRRKLRRRRRGSREQPPRRSTSATVRTSDSNEAEKAVATSRRIASTSDRAAQPAREHLSGLPRAPPRIRDASARRRRRRSSAAIDCERSTVQRSVCDSASRSARKIYAIAEQEQIRALRYGQTIDEAGMASQISSGRSG